MPSWTGPPHRSKRRHRKCLQHTPINRPPSLRTAAFNANGQAPGGWPKDRTGQDFRIRRASTTTTALGWRLHPAFTAGGAAFLVGAARPFVA